MKRPALYICLIGILIATALGRRVWEPTDVMPMFSLRSATGIAITERYIYITTEHGVIRFPCWNSIIEFDDWEAFSIPGGVSGIEVSGDSIYLFSGDGVFARREMDFTDIPFEPVASESRFAPDIGACPPRGGLYSMPPGLLWQSDGTIHDLHLRQYSVTDCADDGHGRFYFTTNGIGVLRVDKRSGVADGIVFGPCCNSEAAMASADNSIIFGGCYEMCSCALTIFDRSGGAFEWIEGEYTATFPGSGPVTAIAPHGNGLFVGTPAGLVFYDLEDNNWLRATARGSIPVAGIRGLTILDDTIFVASDDGLYYADLATRIFTRISEPGVRRFNDISVVGGTVYIVGEGGAWKKEGRSFLRFDPPGGILTGYVNCVSSGADGEAVFGSRIGVLILDKHGNSVTLPINLHLDGYPPNDIAATERFIWVATDRGLYVFDRLRGVSIRLGSRHFMPEVRIYRLLLDGDWLWLSTEIGIYRFFWNEPGREYY